MKASLGILAAFLAIAGLMTACSKPADAPAAASERAARAPASAAAHEPAGIAWKYVSGDADVDAAFAQAKAEGKPLFLYWGAKWCPPCNHVKATLFNRVDFIERSRAFVPVYVDGDKPGAQKLGARFKVRGYPTMVLFNAQGTELTRLPGEVDPAQYTQVLTVGMNAQRPVRRVLADARAGRPLAPNDWKLLAFYAWETDEQQAAGKDGTAALLHQLALACPADQVDTRTRLRLKAMAAMEGEDRVDAAERQWLFSVLADPAASRTHMDVITGSAESLVRSASAPASPDRARLVMAYFDAMKRLEADTTLSRADRLMALLARVELARLFTAKDAAVPEALQAEVREHVARVDREITDGYERQAVITSAAYLLVQAGLLDESDALLKSNLAKSHSPYYLMSSLASNARKRGDKAEALRWSEEAFAKSEGPATRLQWGASYVNALVELSPQDEARIERAVQQLLREASAQPNALYDRSARSLQKAGSALTAWNQGGRHAASMKRLRVQFDALCAKLSAGDEQKAVCEVLLKRPAA